MSKPETGLQAQIVKALEALGVRATRINCGRTPAKRGWIYLAKIGTPDLLLEMYRTSWLETKMGSGGRLQPHQEDRHRELGDSGSRVAVVRSVEQALRVVLGWRDEDRELQAMVREREALREVGLEP